MIFHVCFSCAFAGEVITCSRDVTLVYYLTKGWSKELGGCFVDLEAADAPGGRRIYVPQFNTAVLFRVPRFHQVTPVTTTRPRWVWGGGGREAGERLSWAGAAGPQQGHDAGQALGHAPLGIYFVFRDAAQVFDIWLVPAARPAV